MSNPTVDRVRWLAVVPALAGLLLLVFSFGDYYTYGYGGFIRRLCGAPCAGTVATRTAWHGQLGWTAVVLALLAGLCAATATTRERERQVLVCAALVLDLAAAGCLFAAIAVIPEIAPFTQRMTTVLGGDLHYGDLVSNHHGWRFWVSLAIAVVGAGGAAAQLIAVRAEAREPDTPEVGAP